MAKITQHNSSKELNNDYLKSFVATRGGIGSLYISWAGFPISLLLTVFTWNISK